MTERSCRAGLEDACPGLRSGGIHPLRCYLCCSYQAMLFVGNACPACGLGMLSSYEQNAGVGSSGMLLQGGGWRQLAALAGENLRRIDGVVGVLRATELTAHVDATALGNDAVDFLGPKTSQHSAHALA